MLPIKCRRASTLSAITGMLGLEDIHGPRKTCNVYNVLIRTLLLYILYIRATAEGMKERVFPYDLIFAG